MDVVQLLGANVRRHRELKGMFQEQLALGAGMKRSYVSDFERGTRNPSVRARSFGGRARRDTARIAAFLIRWLCFLVLF